MGDTHSLPGGYSFLREIGRGAFAGIYEGLDGNGRKVAIKMLRNPTEMAKKRFAREVKVLQELPQNRHIVRYLDSGHTQDNTPFLVLELLEGTTLANILQSGRRFSETAAATLMLQLCDAFTELHKLGVTHGDIKPTNIMLTTEARDEGAVIVTKLLDFGLVRDSQGLLRFFEDWQMIDGLDFQEDLDTGVVAGTAEYIAPEIVSDAKAKDPQKLQTDTPSDVFGLGVIMYVLVTGHSPWPFYLNKAQPFLKQFRGYLSSRFDQALKKPEHMSSELWSIISTSLQQNPRARQGDARDLRAQLERFLKYGAGFGAQAAGLAAIDSLTAETTPQSSYIEEQLVPELLVSPQVNALRVVTGTQSSASGLENNHAATPNNDHSNTHRVPRLPAWTPLAISLIYAFTVLLIYWWVV